MIKKEMIAPCGLNCALCKRALFGATPCGGCHGPDECKPDYCSKICTIVDCEERKQLADGFCDECKSYPCAQLVERELRYANDYPMVESPMGNLEYIRINGIERFLEAEEERWSCPECEALVCVHDGKCSGCGKTYTVRTMKRG